MNLTDVHKHVKSHAKRTRVGRGEGSGLGKTSGRGHKGFGQRNVKTRIRYEGGQMPIIRRYPKRGFTNAQFTAEYTPVNLSSLEKLFAAGENAGPEEIKAKGLVKNVKMIKVLGNGELTKKLAVRAHAFSRAAVEKIEKAGGTAEVIK